MANRRRSPLLNIEPTETQCFHCGEPLPIGGTFSVSVDNSDRAVCCFGCQTVANLIAGAAMTAFYQQRTDYPPTPEQQTTQTSDWYNDKTWLQTFAKVDAAQQEIPLMVTGMSCAACAWIIERFVQEVENVQSVNIQLALGKVTINLSPDSSAGPAIEVLQGLGYGVQPWRADSRLQQMREDYRRDLRRLGIAFLGMMQVGMFAIALHAGALQGIDADLQQLLRVMSAPLTLFVLTYSGREFFERAWQHLKHRTLIMDSSVSLALVLATAASLWSTVQGGGETYYDSVTMFVFFLLLARFVEKRLRDRDLIQLVQLADELPEFVAVLRDHQWQRLPRDSVSPGATIRVATGEAIAFDSRVISGTSVIDEAVFTGESLPRSVQKDDVVFAGTVNEGASLELIVEHRFNDSRLAALAHDIDRAREEKPAHLQLIDQFAARFISIVLLAAAITFVAWWNIEPSRAFWASIAVLVVACPCALSLATPAALTAGNAWLGRRGVRVRSETGLLGAAAANHIIFDKTGTLTETQLVISTIRTAQGIDTDTALGTAAALQQFSSHPAARPFHHRAQNTAVRNVEIIAAQGVEGWDGERNIKLRLGNLAFCRHIAPGLPNRPDENHYWVALVEDGRWLAWISLSESLRLGTQHLVAELKSEALTLEILSGDTESRVRQIASSLDLTFTAELKPDEKLSELQKRQSAGATVMAIGDGLNDAPLLRAADVSIAVAGATALAQTQADFVITEENTDRILMIRKAAHATRRITRQNLIWAASYNLVGLPLAALGYIPPWAAALGMSASSLLVVLNALRLRRLKD